MARESALTSGTLYQLSDGGERLFWRLMLVADDFGRFEADPQIIKARCFPRWPDKKMSARRVAVLYGELEAELVRTYVVGGVVYGYFVTWDKHQRRRAQASKYPEPTSDAQAPLADVCQHLSADANGRQHMRPESKSESESKTESKLEALSSAVPALRPHSPHREHARAILAFLNQKAGRSFRPTEANLRLVEARLKTGVTVEDCRGVIARKVRAWLGDPKMAMYLRPETLFNATKFESYLGERERDADV